MTVLDLSKTANIWCGGQEIGEVWTGGSRSWRKPLAGYYGVGAGRVAIHFGTDAANTNATGGVTALRNQGGAGAYFDAVVSGAPLVTADRMVRIPSTSMPALTNAAELSGVHLLWAMVPDTATTMRVFTGTGPVYVSRECDASGRVRLSIYKQGVGSTTGAYVTLPNPGAIHTYELRVTPAEVVFWIDGVNLGTRPVALGTLPLSHLGGSTFAGLMGDVIGVTLGDGADRAVTAARDYLTQRFG